MREKAGNLFISTSRAHKLFGPVICHFFINDRQETLKKLIVSARIEA
jgi:hypothetical protein